MAVTDDILRKVMLDSRLTPTVKAFYSVLWSDPTMSRDAVAAALNRNPRHLRALERQLVEYGYLEVVQREVQGQRIQSYGIPQRVTPAGSDRLAS